MSLKGCLRPFLQPLKAPKAKDKDYDENDLEYLKKKKEEASCSFS